MGQLPQATDSNLIQDFDGSFFQGSKSDCDPSQLPVGYAWNLINMLNLGGVLSCRPGYRCIYTLPDGNLQGLTLFRPLVGVEQLIAVVDGLIYVSPYPFVSFTQLRGVTLLPAAEQVFWAQTLQAAERITEDFASAIKLIPSKAVLFIQDGGFSAPIWYDGAQFGSVQGHAFDTPAGGSMVWVGSRLWVASGNQVFASDVGNPFSFRENIYLGGSSAFFFNGPVTAMAKTPSIEAPQLMVFTELDGSILQANIQDRTQWPTTVDFQVEVVQVGCSSQRSIVSHYGQIAWFSPSGVAIFDPATAGKLTARLPVRDNEMLVSKTRLNDDLSLVATGVFGQFLMFSVPVDDIYNKHTWVLNHASFETLSDTSGPSWSGYWLGTRPVEWAYGTVADVQRIYHISKDADGHNRIWEAFRPERLDNGCPITWAMESRAYFGLTAPTQMKGPGQRARLTWGDIAMAGIGEDIDLGAFYAGGTRGAYKPFLAKRLSVARGSLAFDQDIGINSQLFAFKPQSRVVRTEDASKQPLDSPLASCGAERPENENIDESFQFLIVGHGPATIRWVRAFGQTVPEAFQGSGTACTDETGVNAVRFDGVGVAANDEAGAIAALAAVNTQRYTSVQTVSVTQKGFSEVGVGNAESIVSQEAADRVAGIIATKQAEAALFAVVPPVVSQGVGLP
jgi:hypothetical protein